MKRIKKYLSLILASFMLIGCAPGGGTTGGGTTDNPSGGGTTDNPSGGGGQGDKPTEHTHKDSNNDHNCDECGQKMTDHIDNNHDHYCDLCHRKISEHIDNDRNHYCDTCSFEMSYHIDEDFDHYCDICMEKISDHQINFETHECDYCGQRIQCEDNNHDHLCDYCEETISGHIDLDEDGQCDECGMKMGEEPPKEKSELFKHVEDVSENVEYIPDISESDKTPIAERMSYKKRYRKNKLSTSEINFPLQIDITEPGSNPFQVEAEQYAGLDSEVSDLFSDFNAIIDEQIYLKNYILVNLTMLNQWVIPQYMENERVRASYDYELDIVKLERLYFFDYGDGSHLEKQYNLIYSSYTPDGRILIDSYSLQSNEYPGYPDGNDQIFEKTVHYEEGKLLKVMSRIGNKDDDVYSFAETKLDGNAPVTTGFNGIDRHGFVEGFGPIDYSTILKYVYQIPTETENGYFILEHIEEDYEKTEFSKTDNYSYAYGDIYPDGTSDSAHFNYIIKTYYTDGEVSGFYTWTAMNFGCRLYDVKGFNNITFNAENEESYYLSASTPKITFDYQYERGLRDLNPESDTSLFLLLEGRILSGGDPIINVMYNYADGDQIGLGKKVEDCVINNDKMLLFYDYLEENIGIEIPQKSKDLVENIFVLDEYTSDKMFFGYSFGYNFTIDEIIEQYHKRTLDGGMTLPELNELLEDDNYIAYEDQIYDEEFYNLYASSIEGEVTVDTENRKLDLSSVKVSLKQSPLLIRGNVYSLSAFIYDGKTETLIDSSSVTYNDQEIEIALHDNVALPELEEGDYDLLVYMTQIVNDEPKRMSKIFSPLFVGEELVIETMNEENYLVSYKPDCGCLSIGVQYHPDLYISFYDEDFGRRVSPKGDLNFSKSYMFEEGQKIKVKITLIDDETGNELIYGSDTFVYGLFGEYLEYLPHELEEIEVGNYRFHLEVQYMSIDGTRVLLSESTDNIVSCLGAGLESKIIVPETLDGDYYAITYEEVENAPICHIEKIVIPAWYESYVSDGYTYQLGLEDNILVSLYEEGYKNIPLPHNDYEQYCVLIDDDLGEYVIVSYHGSVENLLNQEVQVLQIHCFNFDERGITFISTGNGGIFIELDETNNALICKYMSPFDVCDTLYEEPANDFAYSCIAQALHVQVEEVYTMFPMVNLGVFNVANIDYGENLVATIDDNYFSNEIYEDIVVRLNSLGYVYDNDTQEYVKTFEGELAILEVRVSISYELYKGTHIVITTTQSPVEETE